MIASYKLFSSEKIDATQTRRIFRCEFAHLPTGDFGSESGEPWRRPRTSMVLNPNSP